MAELKQTIRFCTSSDGARIAYATMGRGPPLVRAAHFLTHLEFELLVFFVGLSATIVLYQIINFHHYIVDATIWKVRKAPMRKTLGLQP